MSNNYRELTGREKQRMKKLVTSLCANYDKEYGCLPLDCDCPMSVSYTHLDVYKRQFAALMGGRKAGSASSPTTEAEIFRN